MKNNVITIEQDQTPTTAGSNSMMFNPAVMEQVNAVATMMASGRSTVPQHLQKSLGDCFAVVMQAAQWGMNPFAVAQKTHLVNGTLGYEAQLVNAVVSSSNAIKGRFKYEYEGDWKQHGVKGSDAAIRVGAVLSGDEEITWGEWLHVGDVGVKNSPLWKTAPKQQAAYLAVKYWARLFCPEVILGVYSPDEFDEPAEPTEKEINPRKEQSRVASVKEKAKAKMSKKAKVIEQEPAPDPEISNDGEINLDFVLNEIKESQNPDDLNLAIDSARHLKDADKEVARKAFFARVEELKAE